MNPQITNFALQPKRALPRYQTGAEVCVECGKLRGRAYQTFCDNCGRMVCINCRRDGNGNAGFRNIPYVCDVCKSALQSWGGNNNFQTPTASVDDMFVRLAEANKLLEESNDVDAEVIINELFKEVN